MVFYSSVHCRCLLVATVASTRLICALEVNINFIDDSCVVNLQYTTSPTINPSFRLGESLRSSHPSGITWRTCYTRYVFLCQSIHYLECDNLVCSTIRSIDLSYPRWAQIWGKVPASTMFHHHRLYRGSQRLISISERQIYPLKVELVRCENLRTNPIIRRSALRLEQKKQLE